MTDTIYQAQLMDHFRQPRNKASTADASITAEGFNANCGDKVKLGLFIDGQTISSIKYQIRACAICTASTSIMSEQLTGKTFSQAKKLINQIKVSVKTNAAWPQHCEALSGPAVSINRHKCILLGWQACEDALKQMA